MDDRDIDTEKIAKLEKRKEAEVLRLYEYHTSAHGLPMDFCFEFSGLFLGGTGAVGVGYYTGFFNKGLPPPLMTMKDVPPQVAKVAADFPKAHDKMKQMNKLVAGGPIAWRITKRAALGGLLYCFLECKMQGYGHYRRASDCAIAGALSGVVFGSRGGFPMAAYSAAGFSAYAIVSYFLYH